MTNFVTYLEAMQLLCGFAFVICGSLSLYFFISSADFTPQIREEIYTPILPLVPQSPENVVVPSVEIPERLSVLVRNKKGESHYRIVTRKQAIANARFISKGKGIEYGAFYYAAENRFFECWEYAPLSEVEARKKALMVSADDLFVQL